MTASPLLQPAARDLMPVVAIKFASPLSPRMLPLRCTFKLLLTGLVLKLNLALLMFSHLSHRQKPPCSTKLIIVISLMRQYHVCK